VVLPEQLGVFSQFRVRRSCRPGRAASPLTNGGVWRNPRGDVGHVLRYEAPLMSTMAPAVDSDPGDARKTTTRAISSGVAARRIGLCARIESPAGPPRYAAAMSVSTNPGATVVT
jgi:hypothetical protein